MPMGLCPEDPPRLRTSREAIFADNTDSEHQRSIADKPTHDGVRLWNLHADSPLQVERVGPQDASELLGGSLDLAVA